MKSTALLATAALVGIFSLPCLAAPNSKAKTQQELEKEVVALRAKLKEQEQMTHLWLQETVGVGDNAVRTPFGRFLLIKNGSQCLALRFTEHVNFRFVNNSQQYTSRYEWFLQTDGSMDFSKPNVRKGTGEISEGKGGSSYFQPSSFLQLQWSSGDWIYFMVGGTPVGGYEAGSEDALRAKNLRMAPTEWIRIQDVNARSRTVRWFSKEEAKKFAQEL